MAQYDDGVILHWNQRKFTRLVSYLPSTNTPVFHSAPGARSYKTYVAVIEALKGHPLFAHITLVRSERSAIAALVTEMLETPVQ